MNDIQGHYKRSDNGEQSFFLIKLNLHTKGMKRLDANKLRTILAIRLERAKFLEDVDFTIEIAKYYDKDGE